jgi:hypothetical protein
MGKCEHRLTSRECYVCASPKHGAAAPPRREWQSLTEEEISDIFEAEPRYHYPPIGATDREFARAIEQALKEKNA